MGIANGRGGLKTAVGDCKRSWGITNGALRKGARLGITSGRNQSWTAGVMRDFGPDVATVAVLTPYKAQLVLLKSAFAGQHSKSALANVDFATVDGFQVVAESHAVYC